MKRYKYSTKNDPKMFRYALDFLKEAQEFDGTAEKFFVYTNVWEIIPTNLFEYFDLRPYLEKMGLQDQLDKEIKRIIGDEDGWYPYDERYGFYIRMPGSGNNIIQILCPFRAGGLVPYDEWETDKDAIERLSECVIEEI